MHHYKGYTIELIQTDGYRAWTIFDNDGNVVDATETLSGAKRLVTAIIKPKPQSNR